MIIILSSSSSKTLASKHRRQRQILSTAGGLLSLLIILMLCTIRRVSATTSSKFSLIYGTATNTSRFLPRKQQASSLSSKRINTMPKTNNNDVDSTTTRIVRKDLWIMRHGQAMHNPRAEEAKENGCSHDEFLELMRQDDCLDAPLTELGQDQARTVYNTYFSKATTTNKILLPNIVISSPLSRAIETADLAFPITTTTTMPSTMPKRIVYEGFREINGWLLNAQRRTKTELSQIFPHWDFQELTTELDNLWQPDRLEDYQECAKRGLLALEWLCQYNNDGGDKNADTDDAEQQHQRILLVAHGGLLRFIMEMDVKNHKNEQSKYINANGLMTEQEENKDGDNAGLPAIEIRDGRTGGGNDNNRTVHHRFSNCELRRYQLEYHITTTIGDSDDKVGKERKIVLTELDL